MLMKAKPDNKTLADDEAGLLATQAPFDPTEYEAEQLLHVVAPVQLAQFAIQAVQF